MPERKVNLVITIIGAVAVLAILAWYAQLRLQNIQERGDLSFDAVFGDAQRLATGMPMDDMSMAIKKSEGSSGLPVLWGEMPELEGIASWLNSGPLTRDELKGKVVLVDFWTYSCINCIRTLPYLTGWYEKYKDENFVLIGVHTPEFAFEKDERNVRKAIDRHDITYPVALDNEYDTWDNFANRYWPAHYLFDAEGRLRYTHFGEGEYDVTERNIQLLLEEAGTKAEGGMLEVDAETDVDFRKIGTPETYIGYRRQELLGSPEPVVRDEERMYSVVDEPVRNRFYLEGMWRVGPEEATLTQPVGAITYRYYASDANLVMGATEGEVSVEVRLDGGAVPEGFRGDDIEVRDGKTYLTVNEERLYSIIRTDGDYGEHLLELIFEDAGVQAYAFTFG